VAFGLDRAALASVHGFVHGQVTCQLIPPGFAGYQRYCPLTLGGGADGRWAGPDVATALDLVRESGTRGARVVYLAAQDQPFPDVGRLVVRQLNRLGYRATMVTDFGLADDPHNDWNAGAIGWLADYPVASNTVQGIGSCGGLSSGGCDREIDKQIRAALAHQVADPGTASDAWAAIDHNVVDAAAIIPFSNSEHHELVSRRVGNSLVHPRTGMLIAQLWVQ
jgi:peptide/nickel transport system substrate-binding protein